MSLSLPSLERSPALRRANDLEERGSHNDEEEESNDDRPEVRLHLTDMLRPLPALLSTIAVSDGFALVDAHHAEPADVILIGFHDLGGSAEQAMSLMLGMDPSAVIIIVGSVDDAELLMNACVRGARGLVLWDWTKQR